MLLRTHNIILLLYYTTVVNVYDTQYATTVVAETSWRGNTGIVHTMLLWHNNSFTAAPMRLVATADILQFVVARYSPDTGAPPPHRDVSGYVGEGIVAWWWVADIRGCAAMEGGFDFRGRDTRAAAAHRYAWVTRDFLHFYFLTLLAEFTVWYLASVVTSRPLHCFPLSLLLSNFRLPLLSELCSAHSIIARLFPEGTTFLFHVIFIFYWKKKYIIFVFIILFSWIIIHKPFYQ